MNICREEVESYRKKHPSMFPMVEQAREGLMGSLRDIDLLAVMCVRSGRYEHWYYERSIGELMLFDVHFRLSEQLNQG